MSHLPKSPVSRLDWYETDSSCISPCPWAARCGRFVQQVGPDLCDVAAVPSGLLAAWAREPAARLHAIAPIFEKDRLHSQRRPVA